MSKMKGLSPEKRNLSKFRSMPEIANKTICSSNCFHQGFSAGSGIIYNPHRGDISRMKFVYQLVQTAEDSTTYELNTGVPVYTCTPVLPCMFLLVFPSTNGCL